MKKYFLLGTLLVISSLSLFLFGQKVISAEVIADVSVRNIEIVSKTDSTIKVQFDLVNKGTPLSNIKYGIRLVEGTNTVDSFIANESISLALKETRKINISYNIPVISAGKYQIVFDAKLASGIPVAFGVGPFIDIAERPSITINPSSCFLTVVGDKSGTQYTLEEGVDIAPSEKLVVNCEVKNTFSQTVKITPYMADFIRNRYGEALGGASYDTYAVDIKAGETKKVQVPVVLPVKAQAYDTSLSFRDGQGFESNTIFAHYVIRGASATIQQISLDKASYEKGSSAQATVSWTGSADSFPDSRIGSGTVISGLIMNVELSSGSVKCGTASQVLESGSFVETISIPVEASCSSPRLRVLLSDKGGSQLAVANYFVPVTNPVVVEKDEDSQSGIPSFLLFVVMGIVSVLMLIVALVLKKKKPVLVVGLLLALSLGLVSTTEAATVSWKDKGNHTHTAYVDLDGDAYKAGDSVGMTTNFDNWYQWCSNGAKKTINFVYQITDPSGTNVKVSQPSSVSKSQSVFSITDSTVSGTYRVKVVFGDGALVPDTWTTSQCDAFGPCMDSCYSTYQGNPPSSCISSCGTPPQLVPCQIPATYNINEGGAVGIVNLSFEVIKTKIEDKAPQGAVDSASCNTINGWTFDGDVPGTYIDVHVYKDGPAGSGSFVGGYAANTSRPDINSVFGVPGNHGIGISIPDSLKDGQSHDLYVYAIGKDASGNNNGNNPLLPGSPKTIKCDPVPKTCTDANASNVGQPLPCTYIQKCTDSAASNYGGALPCAYNKTLTLSSGSCGMSLYSGSGVYASGTSVNYSISSVPTNLSFVNWTNRGTGAVVSGNRSSSIVLGTNTELVANCISNVTTDCGCSVTGSVSDTDSPNSNLTVRVYSGGPVGTGTMIAEQLANLPSHGFNVPVPDSLKTGNDVTVWVYALGVDSSGARDGSDLFMGTRVVNCPASNVCQNPPANFGEVCMSAPNSCGQTASGTYGCDGLCSASAPADSLCDGGGGGDACPNIDGFQLSVPAGMIKNGSGNCLCPEGVACGGGTCDSGLEKDASGVCRPTFTLACPSSDVALQITQGFGALSQVSTLGIGSMSVSGQTVTLRASLESSLGSVPDAVMVWNGSVAPSTSAQPNAFSPSVSTKVLRQIDNTATYHLSVVGQNEFGITKTCSINLKSSVTNVIIKEN